MGVWLDVRAGVALFRRGVSAPGLSGKNVETLCLNVTSDNTAAGACYHGIGFSLTGRTKPSPNDPARLETEMCAEVDWLTLSCE